jgi:hypothetical protein
MNCCITGLKTMTIHHRQHGGDLISIGQKISQFLSANP